MFLTTTFWEMPGVWKLGECWGLFVASYDKKCFDDHICEICRISGLFEALYGKRLLAAIFERGRCYQELRHGGSKHCMVRCSWRPCLEDV